jgi:hypothetical protein
VVRNAWKQLALDVSRRLQSWHKKSKTTIVTPRVCPSVVSVLRANAVSNQVVGVFEQDDSADYESHSIHGIQASMILFATYLISVTIL